MFQVSIEDAGGNNCYGEDGEQLGEELDLACLMGVLKIAGESLSDLVVFAPHLVTSNLLRVPLFRFQVHRATGPEPS